MKDISIIIPSYNSEKTISACIESVISECDSCNLNYEIIVIDDGSSDSSPEIINKLSKKNNNILYFRQENAGPSAARNNGLSRTCGNLIALIDSDDIWLSGNLNKQIEFLKNHPQVYLVSCTGNNTVYNTEKILTFRDTAFHNYFTTSAVLFKKDLSHFRFPEDMKYSEDFRFFLTIMMEYTCAYIPFVGVKNYFDKSSFGESGLSANLSKMEAGELLNLRFIRKNKKISLPLYLTACLYSIAKYFRRCIISAKFKKNK